MEDWTQMGLTALGTSGLTWLGAAFFKPWSSAYSEEKGKNYARQEDIDKILAEVRAVTITQKEIEKKLSGDLWHEQQRRNEKKELYIQFFATWARAERCLNRMHETLSRRDTKAFGEGLQECVEALQELDQQMSVFVLFMPIAVHKPLVDLLTTSQAYLKVLAPMKDVKEYDLGSGEKLRSEIQTAWRRLRDQIRLDLGVQDPKS